LTSILKVVAPYFCKVPCNESANKLPCECGANYRPDCPEAWAQGRGHSPAFRNPVDVFETANGMTMFVGADRVGVNLLEVGFFGAEEDEAVVIVHAMVARPKFLR
jgi:hypothetical protein